MVVVRTGYLGRVAYGTVRNGPLDIIIEPVKKLLDVWDSSGVVKCYPQAVIPVYPEPLHVGRQCLLCGWDHGLKEKGHGNISV